MNSSLIPVNFPPSLPTRPITKLACALLLLLAPLRGAQRPDSAPPAPPTTVKKSGSSSRNWLSSLFFRPFDPNPDMEMTVITEMTDEGRKLPAVSPDHPAYYQAVSSGNRERGDLVSHEQTMPPEEVEPLLTRGLTVNGYRVAELPAHPPSLLVYYFWGTHNAILADSADETTYKQVFSNVLDRATLVGGRKFVGELTRLLRDIQDLQDAKMFQMIPSTIANFKWRKADNEQLMNLTLGDVFYVVATAFDYQSVARGRPVLLWRTHMSVMSQGVQMKKAIPAVVAGAAPYFGREMTDPVVIHQSSTPDGKVKIGTPTVVAPPPASRAAEETEKK